MHQGAQVSLALQSCARSDQWACSRTDQLVHVKSRPWCAWILLATAATPSVSHTLCHRLMLVSGALRSSLARLALHPIPAYLPMPLPRPAAPRVTLFTYAGDSDSLERPAGARCDSPAVGRDFLLRCVHQRDISNRVSPLALRPHLCETARPQAICVRLRVLQQ